MIAMSSVLQERETIARVKSAADLERLRAAIISKRDPNRPCITLCSGTGCLAYASEKVGIAFEEELKSQGLEKNVELRRTGCHGFCEKGPLVVIFPEEICYIQVKPEDVPEIVSQTLNEGQVVERLLYVDPITGDKLVHEKEIPFYKHQTRLVFGNNSRIDPRSIDDYIALGGYSALSKALSDMSPEEVIDTTKKSGLRGRGGGGFPTGRKWEEAAHIHSDVKYVIVNADEGDPGA